MPGNGGTASTLCGCGRSAGEVSGEKTASGATDPPNPPAFGARLVVLKTDIGVIAGLINGVNENCRR